MELWWAASSWYAGVPYGRPTLLKAWSISILVRSSAAPAGFIVGHRGWATFWVPGVGMPLRQGREQIGNRMLVISRGCARCVKGGGGGGGMKEKASVAGTPGKFRGHHMSVVSRLLERGICDTGPHPHTLKGS